MQSAPHVEKFHDVVSQHGLICHAMTYRFSLLLLCLITLNVHSQPPVCCEDATCTYCWEVEVCQSLPGFSPSESVMGGFENCGVDGPGPTLCSSWTENSYPLGQDIGCLCACGDPMACNFDPVHGTSVDCITCDYSCLGCTDPSACNFTIGATMDDGSCDLISCYGCTDSSACNFDQTATQDDGSCIPSGCMETDACNYSAEAGCDDGSCDFSCCPGPGCCLDGTVWDAVLEGCVIANPTDVDLDGCTGVGDVLEVLSLFGVCVNVSPG